MAVAQSKLVTGGNGSSIPGVTVEGEGGPLPTAAAELLSEADAAKVARLEALANDPRVMEKAKRVLERAVSVPFKVAARATNNKAWAAAVEQDKAELAEALFDVLDAWEVVTRVDPRWLSTALFLACVGGTVEKALDCDPVPYRPETELPPADDGTGK